jgi:hypothetical protein
VVCCHPLRVSCSRPYVHAKKYLDSKHTDTGTNRASDLGSEMAMKMLLALICVQQSPAQMSAAPSLPLLPPAPAQQHPSAHATAVNAARANRPLNPVLPSGAAHLRDAARYGHQS